MLETKFRMILGNNDSSSAMKTFFRELMVLSPTNIPIRAFLFLIYCGENRQYDLQLPALLFVS